MHHYVGDDNAMQLTISVILKSELVHHHLFVGFLFFVLVKVILYIVHVHLLLKFVVFPMPFFCVV